MAVGSWLKKLWPGVIVTRCGFVLKKVAAASPYLVGLLCLLTVVSALEPILSLWISKQLIDSVVEYLRVGATSAEGAAALHRAVQWVIIECGIGLTSIGMGQFNGYVSNRLSREVTFHMRQEIYQHCIRLDYPFFESPSSQDILVRCQNMSVNSVTGMFYNIMRLGGMVITIAGSLAALFHFSWVLCLAAFLVGLPNLWLNARLAKQRYRTYWNRSERTRWTSHYGWLLTMPNHAKETIMLGLGRYFYDKWKEGETKTLKEDLGLAAKQNWIQTGMGWLNRLTSTGAYLGVVVLTARKAGGTFGAVTMNVGLFARAQGQVQALSDALAGLNNDAMFLEDYFILMKKEPGSEGRGQILPLGEPIRSIEFRDVSFTYPEAETETLHNVSFRFTQGESLFMAGRNGAGKTSIIKLLLRLYEPTTGHILVNDRDISDFPAESLRKSFSVLMQDYSRYPFTVRENIIVGDIDHLDDEPRLEHAIRASKFSDIMPKLPEGLDSFVGRHFHGHGKRSGIDLSGGEWQKLGLARSFFRDSSVFILDEPTSNLDVQSESEVLSYFKEHVRDKLAIIVSHRLSAASVADRVLFVDGGRIVEDGKHADLIQGNGPYASLFRLQQEGFSFL